MSDYAAALRSRDSDLLRAVALAPFAKQRDLAAMLRIRPDTVRGGLRRLKDHRLIHYTRYKSPDGMVERRWFVTAWGTLYLAWMEGVEFEDAERRYPVSPEIQQRFLEHLDVVASIYEVVRQLAGATSGALEWRWGAGERLGGFVSVGQKCFGVLRLGRSVENEQAARMMCEIGWLQRTRDYPSMLVLRPGPLEVDRLVSDCRDASGGWIYVASEDALSAGKRGAVWRRFGCPSMELPEVVHDSGFSNGYEVSDYWPGGARLDEAILGRGIPEAIFSETPLLPAHRRLLGILYEWPLATMAFLSAVVGVEAGGMVRQLAESGYVRRITARGLSGERYCLSDVGLAWFAERDGELRADLLARKSLGSLGSGGGRAGAGSETREIWDARERWDRAITVIEWFCRDIRERETVKFVEAAPGMKWSREVEVGERRLMFTPEAILRVVQDGEHRELFMEMVEEGAVGRGLQMKIGLFLAYARSVDASMDSMGRKPLMLLLIKGEKALRSLRGILQRRFRFPVPVFVSGLQEAQTRTLFGRIWQNASERDDNRLTFNELVEKEVIAPGYRDYGAVQVFEDLDGSGREFKAGRGLQAWLREAGERG